LLAAYRLCWRVQAGARLLTDQVLDVDKLGLGGQVFLLREAGETAAADLTVRLAALVAIAAAVIEARLDDQARKGTGSDAIG